MLVHFVLLILQVALCTNTFVSVGTTEQHLTCEWREIRSCSHLKHFFNTSGNFVLRGTPSFCEFSGGWTMCATKKSFFSTKSSNAQFKEPEYLSDCSDVKFNQILFINHEQQKQTVFSTSSVQTLQSFSAQTDFNSTQSNLFYELLVCNNFKDLLMAPKQSTKKTCSDFQRDTLSEYYGISTSIRGGVSFQDNAYDENISVKTVSIGLRYADDRGTVFARYDAKVQDRDRIACPTPVSRMYNRYFELRVTNKSSVIYSTSVHVDPKESLYAANAITCNSIAADDESVCSGHGVCAETDFCTCEQGYEGQFCEAFKCNNIRNNNSTVCSGHGVCTAPNTCSCMSGYSDSDCSTMMCHDVEASSYFVCSFHGNCIGPNQCNCSFGYSGNTCANYSCFGVDSHNASSCSGHGYCYAPNSCYCVQGFSGEDCSVNINSCDPAKYCSSRGVCTISNCTVCPAGYNTSCSCFSSYLTGFYAGANCSTCADSYFGETCRSTYSNVLLFAPEGDRLLGRYVIEQNDMQGCSDLFHPDSLALLGEYSFCFWPNYNHDLVIYIDYSSTLLPGATLLLNIGSTLEPRYINVSVVMPTVNITFNIISDIPPLGSCNDLIAYAGDSYTSDMRSLSFYWELVTPNMPLEFVGYVEAFSRYSFLYVPGAYIPYGNFSIRLTVTNFLNISRSITIDTYKERTTIPNPVIRGASEQFAFASDYYVIEGGFPDGCELSLEGLNFFWSQTAGPHVEYDSSLPYLLFFPGALKRYANISIYEFTLTLNQSNVLSPPARVSVTILPQDLTAYVVAPVRVGMTDDIELDGSYSFDPDQEKIQNNFTWTCLNATRHQCMGRNGTLVLPNTNIVTIPKGTLRPGIYIFILNYVVGSRSSRANATVRVADNTPFSISFAPVPTTMPPQERIVLSVRQISSTISYLWNCNTPINQSNILTPLNSPVLVFKENTFHPGASVTCTLTASRGNASVASNLTFSISTPPVPGSFSVLPANGSALLTSFKLVANRFTGNTPFKYSFGYINPDDGARIFLSTLDVSSSIDVKLPQGVEVQNFSLSVFVTVIDKFSAERTVFSTVRVQPPQNNNLTSVVERVSQNMIAKLKQKDLSDALTSASAVYSTITGNVEGEGMTSTRETVLSSFSSLANDKPEMFSSKFVTQTATLLAGFSTPTMSPSVKQSSLDVVDRVLNGTASSSVTTLAASTLSNMVRVNASSNEEGVSKHLMKTSEMLAQRMASSMQPGEAPNVISTPSIQFVAAKHFASSLSQKPVVSDTVSASFPSAIQSLVPATEPVNVLMNMYNFNPLQQNTTSNSNSTVASGVLSLTLSRKDSIVAVANLSSPIVFTMNAKIPPQAVANFYSPNASNISGIIPTCSYWNGSNWSTDGCKVIAVTLTNITCACNHLTDFAAVLRVVTPKLNVLTVDDLNLIGKINADNYAIIIVICSMFGVFLCCCMFCSLFNFSACNLDINETQGKLRKFMNAYVSSHAWLAFLFLPQNNANFSRPQRLTVLFCGILGAFCGNALTSETQDNIIQVAAAMIISEMISLPFVLFMSLLFSKTALKPSCKVASEISRLTTCGATVIESTKKKLVLPENVKSKALYIFSQIDRALFCIERKAAASLSDNRLTTLILLAISSIYFGLVAFGLFILARAYPALLTSSENQLSFYIIAVLAVDGYLALLLLFFLTVRKTLFNAGLIEVWNIPPYYSAIFFVVGITFIICCTGLSVVMYAAWQIHIYHLSTLFAGVVIQLILFITAFVALNVSMQRSTGPSVLSLLYQKFLNFYFPWWMFIVWYLACFAYIGVLSYLLISYGVKFSNQKSSQWMGASFSSLVVNIFLTNPVKILLRVILLQLAFTVIEWLVKPQKQEEQQPNSNIEISEIEIPVLLEENLEQELQTFVDKQEWESGHEWIKNNQQKYRESALFAPLVYAYYNEYISYLIEQKMYDKAEEKAINLKSLIPETEETITKDVNFLVLLCKAMNTRNIELMNKVITEITLVQHVNKFTLDCFYAVYEEIDNRH